MKTKTFGISVFMMILALFTSGASAAEQKSAAELLKDAWRDYRIQNFDMAEVNFQDAKEAAKSEDEKLQATIGQLFMVQYKMPGADPAAAFNMYKALLTKLGKKHKLRALILSRMGNCLLDQSEPKLDEGREYLQKAFKECKAGSILSQDIILTIAMSYIRKHNTEDIKIAVKLLDDNAKIFKGAKSASAAHSTLAECSYILGDFKRYESELIKFYEAGINDKNKLAPTLFKIARINEVEFSDFEKAGKYYALCYKEDSSNKLSHFAKVRAAEIAAGKTTESEVSLPMVKRSGKAKKGDK